MKKIKEFFASVFSKFAPFEPTVSAIEVHVDDTVVEKAAPVEKVVPAEKVVKPAVAAKKPRKPRTPKAPAAK